MTPVRIVVDATVVQADGAGSVVRVGGEAPLGTDLTAIERLTGTGFLARTADGTWALRTLTAGENVTVTNGAGTAGNPVHSASGLAAGDIPAALSAYLGGWFGTGSDGAHTVSGTETLTGEKHFTDLTVPAGQVLVTDGYRVHVSGTLTLAGTIRDNGNNGSGAGGGGALGESGIRTQTALGGAGRSGTGNGNNGGNYNISLAYPDYNPAGGNGGSVSGGTGGTGSATATAIRGPAVKPLARILAGDTHLAYGGTFRFERPSGGGGGGGCNPGTGTATSGGGGGGGGRVQVFARTLTGAGVFEARGGNGANASATGNGAAGGGGGGTGGRVEVVAGWADGWTGTMSAAGGTAGTGIGETTPATAGGDGAAQLFVLLLAP